MPPELYDIYWAPLRFGRSSDPRPCVVVNFPKPGRVTVAPMSSQMDELNVYLDFLVEASDEDFPATGLTRTSYVSSRLLEIGIELLHRRCGTLRGDLLLRFKRWI